MNTSTLVKIAKAIGLGGFANRWAIKHFATRTDPRPRPFSLWSHVDKGDTANPGWVSDYTSWPGLTDRSFSARHLPPAPHAYVAGLPFDAPYDPTTEKMGDVTALFARTGPMKSSRSSVLFSFFAQWFTDSILRFQGNDRRRNTSNHDIDLCQIYGLHPEATDVLRTKQGGLLKSQVVNGEEMPEYLCHQDATGQWVVKPIYHPIVDDRVIDEMLKSIPDGQARKPKLYATGLERGNSSIGYVAISTIFLREHNRLCRELAQRNPAWSTDDERLFQTARMINIVLLMKLIVEDYINHIIGAKIFELDHTFAEDEPWYRPNWIAAEFDLLYRWHSLMPDKLTVADRDLPHYEYRFNNELLEKVGVSAAIEAASNEVAGRIGLFNTPDFLWRAESKAIEMGRSFRLRPYNDYRERFGLDRLRGFDELVSDPTERQRLEALYPQGIDQLEFVVGIFAEDRGDDALFGELLAYMVAYDAFTQILSNPLLSRRIYGEETFTRYGLDVIEETTSIEALVNRNVTKPVKASLGWP